MRDAYLAATGEGHSRELALLNTLEKYGGAQVLGRVLSAHEVRCMNIADNVARAYRARAQATNWAAWASENKALSDLLAEAEILANG